MKFVSSSKINGKYQTDTQERESVAGLSLSELYDRIADSYLKGPKITSEGGLEMISGGRIMLLLDTVRKEVLRYRLDEPYNLRTARFLDTFDVGGQTDDPRGLSVHPDLESFYITGRDRQAVYQYSRP